MKRTAVSLFVWVALVAWATPGHAKKGGGAKAAAPAAVEEAAPPAADEKAAAGGDDKAAGGEAGGEKEGAASESLDTDETKTAGATEGEGDAKAGAKAPSTLSWQDIVVVERKDFIKSGRLELVPFTGVSVNDNLIRHYAFGLDLNYFLSDALWVGLQGQYFIKALSDREELIGLQYNRITSLNRYLYSAAFNLGYVPVYGKFALFNKSIIHWEIWASGGVGWLRSEIIPRNPGLLSWTNDLIAGNVGIGSRLFLFDWLTVNFAIRDYIFGDKFERKDRDPMQTVAYEKAHADSNLVQNVMAYVGIGMYLPTKFTYKAPR
jgi:outer membrane beta-barrel protein